MLFGKVLNPAWTKKLIFTAIPVNLKTGMEAHFFTEFFAKSSRATLAKLQLY
jgi:hypothetical protein